MIQESSARILFLMINWTKSQHRFNKLSQTDQVWIIKTDSTLFPSLNYFLIHLKVILLEKNWKDLFIISLAQWLVPVHLIDDKDLLVSVQKTAKSGHSLESVLDNYRMTRDIFAKLLHLNLDPTELEYFKMIVLLRNGKFNKHDLK